MGHVSKREAQVESQAASDTVGIPIVESKPLPPIKGSPVKIPLTPEQKRWIFKIDGYRQRIAMRKREEAAKKARRQRLLAKSRRKKKAKAKLARLREKK